MTTEASPYESVFFAHQPVFDVEGNVWGYELYYRGDAISDTARFPDEVRATMEVMANLALCPDTEFKSAPVIINFPEKAVMEQVPYSLHPDNTVVQIADPRELSAGLLLVLDELKSDGYGLSVDDYQGLPNNHALYDLADIITVSVSDTGETALKDLLKGSPDLGGRVLAKKIETKAQYDMARDCGAALFQGFYFKRPETKELRKISSIESLRFKLMQQLNSEETDFDALSEGISQDPSLSMRLLNLLNSPVYGLTSEISSIKQAVVYLGSSQLKQWLRVVILTDLKQPRKTVELIRLSLLRARFLETLGNVSLSSDRANSLFMLGLFSLLDAMLEMTMDHVLELLSAMDDEIKATLRGQETSMSPWLSLAQCMEESNWDKIGAHVAELGLEAKDIMASYQSALSWSNQVLMHI
jgi:EAL and modified HD-GYP domain-containing signal transduction protein